MKKLLSLILAMLMLVMTCQAEGVIGGADGPTVMITGQSIYDDAIAAGRRVKVNVTVPEFTGAFAGDDKIDTAVAELIKALGLSVAVQGSEYDLGVTLTGKEVLNLAWTMQEDDTYINSNLIGDTIVVSSDEVEKLASNILDMLVLLNMFAKEDVTEIKEQLPAMISAFKLAMEQTASAQLTPEDLTELDFSAFEKVLEKIENGMEDITELTVPRMCDAATKGTRVTIDNETFVELVSSLFQFLKDNPKLMDYMEAQGAFVSEETRKAEWETNKAMYERFGYTYEDYIASNPTGTELLDQLSEEIKSEKLLGDAFVTSVYLNDEDEIVYLTSILPMFTQTGVADETAETVSGTTENLNVVYTRQTVAQGTSHVCNIDVDGEGATIDVLAQKNSWTIGVSDATTQEKLITVNAVKDNDVIKGSFMTDQEMGLSGVFSFSHVADEKQFKTDVSATLQMSNSGKTESMTIGYICDYARDGVDFSGKEVVKFAFNDVNLTLNIDIATEDKAESIADADAVRPAALSEDDFTTWFLNVFAQMNTAINNALVSLPSSLLLLLMSSGMGAN